MKKVLISLLALGSFVSLGASTTSYQVIVDTSSIGSSTPGFIEFQFNQANADTSLAATASVDNFSSAGFTFNDSLDASLGGVTGSLSAPPLVFDNTVGGTNLYDQGVTAFGSIFQFTLTLDGPALATPATDGSEFFVYVLAADYSNLLGPSSGVANVTINGDTTITTTPVEGISTITSVSNAPEPSAFSLLGLGGAALLALRRRTR